MCSFHCVVASPSHWRHSTSISSFGFTHAGGVGDNVGAIFVFGLQQYNLFAHCALGFVVLGGVSQSFKGRHWFGFEHIAIGGMVGVGVGGVVHETHCPSR